MLNFSELLTEDEETKFDTESKLKIVAVSLTAISNVQRRKYSLEWFDYDGVRVNPDPATRLYRIKQKPSTLLADTQILAHTLYISSTIVNKVSPRTYYSNTRYFLQLY